MVSARSEAVRGSPDRRSFGLRLVCGELAMDEMRVGTAAGLIMTDDEREGMLDVKNEGGKQFCQLLSISPTDVQAGHALCEFRLTIRCWMN